MTDFQIVPAKQWHCGQIARLMRSEHRAAIVALGFDPHREFSLAYEETLEPKAWLIDGELAAVGGVAGPALSPIGIIWLALARNATRHPLAVVKEAKRQIAVALQSRQVLLTALWPEDTVAIRFAATLGFDIDHAFVGEGLMVTAYSKKGDEWAPHLH